MKTIQSGGEHPVESLSDEPGSRLAPSPHNTNSAAIGADSGLADQLLPDPQFHQQPVRRRFTADYKLRILEEADDCTSPGQIGALLRREGLYSSHLVTWRRGRKEGSFKALAAR